MFACKCCNALLILQVHSENICVLLGAWNEMASNPGVYVDLVNKNINISSTAKDEIERDLHRSLPEHQAFQSEMGIGALRRVLVAYAARNPQIGEIQTVCTLAAILSKSKPKYQNNLFIYNNYTVVGQ